jgi:hypothetical protein
MPMHPFRRWLTRRKRFLLALLCTTGILSLLANVWIVVSPRDSRLASYWPGFLCLSLLVLLLALLSAYSDMPCDEVSHGC